MKGSNEYTDRGREEPIESPLSPEDECASFAQIFAAQMEYLQNLRARGLMGGTIPQEAERPSLVPGAIGKLKNKFTEGNVTLQPDTKKRLLPLFKIDRATRKMSLEIHEIGPESPVAADKISGSLETMAEAIRYINGATDRKQRYPRVYAFIKSFTRYLEGLTPLKDNENIKEFFDVVELNLPSGLADQIYERAFEMTRIKGMMGFVFMNKEVAVRKENFREWLESFTTKNKGVADWHRRIKDLADDQLRVEFIDRFLNEIKTPLPVAVPKTQPAASPGLPSGSTASTSPETAMVVNFASARRTAKPSMHPIPLVTKKSPDLIRESIAKNAAAVKVETMATAPEVTKPDERNAVVQARIIDIVEPMEGLVKNLSGYINEQSGKGARFTGVHMSMMCSLLFEGYTRLVDKKGAINKMAVENISFKTAFENLPNPGQDEKDLIMQLHKLKMALAGQGYLNSQKDMELARAKFVLAIRALGKKKG